MSPRILQISDLRVSSQTTGPHVELAVANLTALAGGPVDYVVVCGGLTATRSAKALRVAADLLAHLADRVLPARPGESADDRGNRLVVVPGPDDVPKGDWAAFQKFYSALYSRLGAAAVADAEWGAGGRTPWVRALKELTVIGLPAEWPESAGGDGWAGIALEAFRQAARHAPESAYCHRTPTVIAAARSPLMCPEGRRAISAGNFDWLLNSPLRPDVYLFGGSQVVCLPSEPLVFPHIALSTGPTPDGWTNRANLIEFRAVGRGFLRVTRLERSGEVRRTAEVVNGLNDEQFAEPKRQGPPARLPLVHHQAFFESLRQHFNAGERVFRLRCLPGSGIRYMLRQLADRPGRHEVLSGWSLRVAHATIPLDRDRPQGEERRELQGESQARHPNDFRPLPGIGRAHDDLAELIGRSADEPSHGVPTLAVIQDDGRRGAGHMERWVAQLRDIAVDYAASGANHNTLYLYTCLPDRWSPGSAELSDGDALRNNFVELDPVIDDRIGRDDFLTESVPLPGDQLRLLSGGYLGIAGDYVGRARASFNSLPGSRRIEYGAMRELCQALPNTTFGEHLRRDWRQFRDELHLLGPTSFDGRPGVGHLFSAYVRRMCDALDDSVRVMERPMFEAGDFREAARVSTHDWEALRDALVRHHILTPIGNERYRVELLAPFVNAPRRVPIFLSFSAGRQHQEYWHRWLFPRVQSAYQARFAPDFLDPWDYLTNQQANSGDYEQDIHTELRRRNNLILLYDDRGQFQRSACGDEVEIWWQTWEATADAQQASFTPVQLGTGTMMGREHLRMRSNRRCTRDQEPPERVVEAIVEALRPDTDPLPLPGNSAAVTNEG